MFRKGSGSSSRVRATPVITQVRSGDAFGTSKGVLCECTKFSGQGVREVINVIEP